MNERIKKLMLEAELFSYDEDIRRYEKFAELIVRECARVSIDSEINSSGDFREGIAQSIQQHFGIEK